MTPRPRVLPFVLLTGCALFRFLCNVTSCSFIHLRIYLFSTGTRGCGTTRTIWGSACVLCTPLFLLCLFRFFGVTRSNSVCFFVFRLFLSVFIVLRRLGIRFSGFPFVLDGVFLLLFITVLPGSVDRTVVRFL